jgi:hypothetical protein
MSKRVQKPSLHSKNCINSWVWEQIKCNEGNKNVSRYAISRDSKEHSVSSAEEFWKQLWRLQSALNLMSSAFNNLSDLLSPRNSPSPLGILVLMAHDCSLCYVSVPWWCLLLASSVVSLISPPSHVYLGWSPDLIAEYCICVLKYHCTP